MSVCISEDKLYDSIYVSKASYDIDLSSSKNPIGASTLAQKAILDNIDTIDYYPDYTCEALRKKIASQYSVQPEALIFGAGADGILQDIIHCFFEKGENLVLPALTYTHPVFAAAAEKGYSKLVPVKENFYFDFDALEDNIDKNTKAVFFANPNNPTGFVEKAEDILSFVRKVPCLVIVDEAVIEYAGKSVIQYAGKIPNLIVVRSFSKGYGLNGLRIGYAAADPDLVQKIVKKRHPFVNSSLALHAAYGALSDDKHLEKTKQSAQKELLFLSEALTQLGFKVFPSSVNCFLARIPNGVPSSTALYEALLEQSCAISDGQKFFGLGNRYVRIALRDRNTHEKFLQILKHILSNFN